MHVLIVWRALTRAGPLYQVMNPLVVVVAAIILRSVAGVVAMCTARTGGHVAAQRLWGQVTCHYRLTHVLLPMSVLTSTLYTGFQVAEKLRDLWPPLLDRPVVVSGLRARLGVFSCTDEALPSVGHPEGPTHSLRHLR